jgi:hypothetical protein
LIAAFGFSPLHADPANVLVGDLTFTRPDAWLWDAPVGKSKAAARFIIPDATGGASSADVRFYFGDKSATVVADVWKAFFPNLKPDDSTEEHKMVGNRQVTYLTFRGSYVFPAGSRGKPGHTFIGAIIPSGDRFVHVIIVGPQDVVTRCMVPFRKMVEDSLRNKESE